MHTILIDLDGVLNQYDGNFNENIIPPIKDGALLFVKKLSEKFDLKLFTTRNRILATKWLIKYGLDEYFSDVTNIKMPSYLILDDRGLCFKGDYSSLLNEIDNFKVWYKDNK